MRAAEFTLTAGPTMASPRVLAALGSPILFDYDPVFLERFRDTERLLAEVYRTTNDVVLMQGEAVLGLEAAARGLVAPGMRCLNLVSGVYAAWFGDWLREYGADVSRGPRALRRGDRPRRRRARRWPKTVRSSSSSIVHSETPSGVENPLAAIGPLAHAHGALMLADVVSSLGGTRARDRRVERRPRRRRPAEVPGRAARHVAGHGQRPRLGGDGGQPRRPARLVPLAA